MSNEDKLKRLQECLRRLGSVAIAFSGGVDSTFLLKVAYDTLGDNVLAVTARSLSFPKRELEEATVFCQKEGIRHATVDSEELAIEGFSHNPVDRCYLCKHELFEKILQLAKQHHLAAVAEGSNLDDEGNYRPGLKAIAELGIQSPLREAGLYKHEIRRYSKAMGLPTWNKPSFACLASRFPYGEEITPEKLHRVDVGEQALLDLGFHQLRVRIHNQLARIEVLPEELQKVMDHRQEIVDALKKAGFTYVSLDLEGYRTGSMNATLEEDKK